MPGICSKPVKIFRLDDDNNFVSDIMPSGITDATEGLGLGSASIQLICNLCFHMFSEKDLGMTKEAEYDASSIAKELEKYVADYSLEDIEKVTEIFINHNVSHFGLSNPVNGKRKLYTLDETGRKRIYLKLEDAIFSSN